MLKDKQAGSGLHTHGQPAELSPGEVQRATRVKEVAEEIPSSERIDAEVRSIVREGRGAIYFALFKKYEMLHRTTIVSGLFGSEAA